MDDEINLLDYFKVIFKYRYLILAVTIIVLLGSTVVFYGKKTVPSYSATATILPVDPNSMYGYSFTMWNRGGGMFNDIIRSRALACRVAEDLNLLSVFRERFRDHQANQPEPVFTLEQGAQILRGMVQIKQAKDGGGLEIVVTAWEPALAANIANSYVRNLKGFLTVNSLNLSFWLLDPALPSAAPVSLQKKNKILIAGVAGLFGGVFLSFMLEYLTNAFNGQNKENNRQELKQA